jgi:hypothetical protein
MADVGRSSARERDLLVAWALGTFHAATLIIMVSLVLYLAGGLESILTSLSTASGLALFGALWLTTVWSTRRWLGGMFDERLRMTLPAGLVVARALWRGGINGIAFLPLLGLILVVSAGPNGAVFLVLFGGLAFATLGVAIAFLVGCVLGLLFAGIDLLLTSAARALLS